MMPKWARSEHMIEYRGRRAGDVEKSIRRAADRAGLPPYIGLYARRHELARRALNEGVDMQKITRPLGHKNVRTTEEIYAKARAGLTRKVVEVTSLPVYLH